MWYGLLYHTVLLYCGTECCKGGSGQYGLWYDVASTEYGTTLVFLFIYH